MSPSDTSSIFQCGREVTRQELEELQETVKLFQRLSRWELAQTICEHLGWVAATGANKVDACLKLLDKLEGQGFIQLPAKRKWRQARVDTGLVRTDRTSPDSELCGELADFRPVWLQMVSDKQDSQLFNEYVDRYHYLRYKKPQQ